MSQSNHAPVASCSKSDLTSEDESRLKKASMTNLIEPVSWKLNFLQVFDNRISAPSEPLLGVPSKTLALHCHQPCPNISFELLPPLGVRDSLENILRIRKYEFPRKNLLKSFVKANSLDRRPRHRLCRNKGKTLTRVNEADPLTSDPCPELNEKHLGHQLAKERKVSNKSSFGRFGQRIKNRIRGDSLKSQLGIVLYPGSSYEEVVSQCRDNAIRLQISPNNSHASRGSHYLALEPAVLETKLNAPVYSILHESNSSLDMLRLLKRLNLNPKKYEKAGSVNKSQETFDDKTTIHLVFENNDSTAWLNNVSSNDNQVAETNLTKAYKDKCGIQLQELNESECKMLIANSPRTKDVESSIDLESCESKVDFSSGDDSRNLTSKFLSVKAESVCKITCGTARQNQLDYESRRRSVQWNSKVDVIYYAGDTDEGTVIRRNMEPLREEADQQARRNGFVKLASNKNLMSAFNGYKFREPWVTGFHK